MKKVLLLLLLAVAAHAQSGDPYLTSNTAGKKCPVGMTWKPVGNSMWTCAAIAVPLRSGQLSHCVLLWYSSGRGGCDGAWIHELLRA
jgi:hypothetical protein